MKIARNVAFVVFLVALLGARHDKVQARSDFDDWEATWTAICDGTTFGFSFSAVGPSLEASCDCASQACTDAVDNSFCGDAEVGMDDYCDQNWGGPLPGNFQCSGGSADHTCRALN